MYELRYPLFKILLERFIRINIDYGVHVSLDKSDRPCLSDEEVDELAQNGARIDIMRLPKQFVHVSTFFFYPAHPFHPAHTHDTPDACQTT